MPVHYSTAARALLDEMTERFRTLAQQTGTHHVSPTHTEDGRSIAVLVWHSDRFGDRLDVSIPASPCPLIATLNAYRYIDHLTHRHATSDFHPWEPHHIQQLAD